MATAGNGRRRTSASSRTQKSTTGSTRKKSSTAARNANTRKRSSQAEESLFPIVLLFVVFCVFIILALCMFGVIGGSFGPFIKSIMLGLFGLLAYILPIVILAAFFYQLFLAKDRPEDHSIAGFIMFWIFLGMFFAFIGTDLDALSAQTGAQDTFIDKLVYSNKKLYNEAGGGGVILGVPALVFHFLFGKGGGLFVIILFMIFSLMLIGGRKFFNSVMELVAGTIDRPVKRRRPVEEEEEWPDEEELARIEEEERLKREENRRRHIEQQREAARRRANREEKARIYQEEKERLREEKRIKKQEDERLRKEAEERAEDERILKTSTPGRRSLRSTTFDTGMPARYKLDDMHEITLLPDVPEMNAQPQDMADAGTDAYMERTGYDDEIREITPTPASAAKKEELPVEEIKIADPLKAAGNEPVIHRMVSEQEEITQEVESLTQEVPVTQEAPVKEEYSVPADTDDTLKDAKEHIPSVKEERTEAVKEQKNETVSSVTPASQNAAERVNDAPQNKPPRPYEKPPISLLKDSKKGAKGDSEAELRETALLLQQTLKSFGVTATVNDISQGPSVTRFELQLGEGIKVNKIVNLADDLKLNLAAEEIRIEAPIPGKAAVGIEIPNKERIPVSLKELIESSEFKKATSKLTFVVGKDIGGRVIVGDIGKMPHLLVAGTTGSGKSVFTNSIIQSILFNAKPEEVKLILIDPKVVEFSVYNDIPHLLMPVVTDPRKANIALAWAVAEMSHRYKLFAEHEVRGIDAYNEQVEKGKVREEDGRLATKLPKIVIVVDELADLMMVAGKEVEDSICRIAQLARAAGIHLIIATQRPSVDVITGLIKANMPSRVALKCGSGVDSRTILDATGAEKLLGYGDMLFSPQGFNKPLRVQGAFVSDEEVQQVAEFLKKQTEKEEVYDQKVLEEVSNLSNAPAAADDDQSQEADGGDGLDEYFDKACRFVVEKEKASSGMLQRVFKIGFNRAARIIDQMEANGVVGPEEGTKPRKVLMGMEQLEAFLKERK